MFSFFEYFPQKKTKNRNTLHRNKVMTDDFFNTQDLALDHITDHFFYV